MAFYSSAYPRFIDSVASLQTSGQLSVRSMFMSACDASRVIHPFMSTPLNLGSHFRHGHMKPEKLSNRPELTFDEYGKAAAICGEEYLESLCASTGAVNIGVYEGNLVLKYKWQGIVLSRHDEYRDVATVIDITDTADYGRLSDTASDLILLLANMVYKFHLPLRDVREWLIYSTPAQQQNSSSTYSTVPVCDVDWYLPQSMEWQLVAGGVTELLEETAEAQVVEMYEAAINALINRFPTCPAIETSSSLLNFGMYLDEIEEICSMLESPKVGEPLTPLGFSTAADSIYPVFKLKEVVPMPESPFVEENLPADVKSFLDSLFQS